MARKMNAVLTLFLIPIACGSAMAIEEANYDVLHKDGNYEIRAYAPSIVVETVITEDFEEAGDKAFRKLFNYISGDNVAREKIAMTAPVAQEKRSEKISMTPPVGQTASANGWAVSFMMPSSYGMDTIPLPTDPGVVLREIPAYQAASIRYSGFWSEKNFQEHLDKLHVWIEQNGLKRAGEPIWARYNPPFTPWFMRRNEILIPLQF